MIFNFTGLYDFPGMVKGTFLDRPWRPKGLEHVPTAFDADTLAAYLGKLPPGPHVHMVALEYFRDVAEGLDSIVGMLQTYRAIRPDIIIIGYDPSLRVDVARDRPDLMASRALEVARRLRDPVEILIREQLLDWFGADVYCMPYPRADRSPDWLRTQAAVTDYIDANAKILDAFPKVIPIVHDRGHAGHFPTPRQFADWHHYLDPETMKLYLSAIRKHWPHAAWWSCKEQDAKGRYFQPAIHRLSPFAAVANEVFA